MDIIDRKCYPKMSEEVIPFAESILKTIEREDAFDEAKNNGGFKKFLKAKEVRRVFQ